MMHERTQKIGALTGRLAQALVLLLICAGPAPAWYYIGQQPYTIEPSESSVQVASGFRGVTYERNPDGSIGTTLAGVSITFTSEDGTITENAATASNGSYYISLIPARYVVTATLQDYEDYSTSPGFFVCTGDGYQTGNFFLKALQNTAPPLPAPTGVYCGWSWTSGDHLDRQVSWNVVDDESVASYRAYVKYPGSPDYVMEMEVSTTLAKAHWIKIDGDGAYKIVSFPSDKSGFTYTLRRKGEDHPVGEFLYYVRAVDADGVEGEHSVTVTNAHAGPMDIISVSGNPPLVSFSGPLDEQAGYVNISVFSQPNGYKAGNSTILSNSTFTSVLIENPSLVIGNTYYLQVYKQVYYDGGAKNASLSRRKMVFILPPTAPAGPEQPPVPKDSEPPRVSISVSPQEIEQGGDVTVTVTGTDDLDLAAIWWWGVNTGDTGLDKAHWHDCSGTSAANSWTVSTANLDPGTYKLGANARDKAYPVPGEPHQASEGEGIAYADFTIIEPSSPAAFVTEAKASIRTPREGKRIRGNAVTIMADVTQESAEVSFQFRSDGEKSWQDISSPDAKPPFSVYWNVSGLENAKYFLRAVARDAAGNDDPEPAEISVFIDDVNADIIEDGNPEVDPNTPHRKQERISAGETSEVILADGTKAIIPPGVVKTSQMLEITVVSIPETGHGFATGIPGRNLMSLGVFREFTFSGGLRNFSSEVTLVLPVPDRNRDGLIDGTSIPVGEARVYYFDESDRKWKPAGKAQASSLGASGARALSSASGEGLRLPDNSKDGRLSAEAGESRFISVRVNHFTLFGLFHEIRILQASGLGEVYAFPNPARGGKNPVLHIETGIADKVEIRIYDIAGDLVHEAAVSGAPSMIDDGQGPQSAYEYAWDASSAASGVYIYVVRVISGSGNFTAKGKLALIK